MKFRAKIVWGGEVNCDTLEEARDKLYEQFDRDASTGEMEFEEFEEVKE